MNDHKFTKIRKTLYQRKSYIGHTQQTLDAFFVYLYLQLTILFLVSVISNQFRSSHWKYSVRKGVLRNLPKFTGKQVFSSEFCEISKNTFFTEHLQMIVSINYNQNYSFRI